MANTREQLDLLALSLDKIAYSGDRAAESPDPVCIDNYANAENLVAKVDPDATGPTFTPIPIRMIISVDGSVKHVHVIRATAAQRSSIERALARISHTKKAHRGAESAKVVLRERLLTDPRNRPDADRV
jgi:hypothetical protein